MDERTKRISSRMGIGFQSSMVLKTLCFEELAREIDSFSFIELWFSSVSCRQKVTRHHWKRKRSDGQTDRNLKKGKEEEKTMMKKATLALSSSIAGRRMRLG